MALERVPRAHIAIKKILPYELRIELGGGDDGGLQLHKQSCRKLTDPVALRRRLRLSPAHVFFFIQDPLVHP